MTTTVDAQDLKNIIFVSLGEIVNLARLKQHRLADLQQAYRDALAQGHTTQAQGWQAYLTLKTMGE